MRKITVQVNIIGSMTKKTAAIKYRFETYIYTSSLYPKSIIRQQVAKLSRDNERKELVKLDRTRSNKFDDTGMTAAPFDSVCSYVTV